MIQCVSANGKIEFIIDTYNTGSMPYLFVVCKTTNREIHLRIRIGNFMRARIFRFYFFNKTRLLSEFFALILKYSKEGLKRYTAVYNKQRRSALMTITESRKRRQQDLHMKNIPQSNLKLNKVTLIIFPVYNYNLRLAIKIKCKH